MLLVAELPALRFPNSRAAIERVVVALPLYLASPLASPRLALPVGVPPSLAEAGSHEARLRAG